MSFLGLEVKSTRGSCITKHSVPADLLFGVVITEYCQVVVAFILIARPMITVVRTAWAPQPLEPHRGGATEVLYTAAHR